MKGALSLTLTCLLALSGMSHAADANLGRNLAATCANCHGTDGHAVRGSGLYSLAGVPRAQMLDKLADFRSGQRPALIMQQIVKGYSDAQLEQIATYFAAQKVKVD